MYLSRITLRRNDASLEELTYALTADGYGEHQVVWRLFADGDRRPRDFLYRKEARGTGIQFYTVSQTRPRDTRGVWTVETKAYQPKITRGDQVAFVLRANPIVTKWVGSDHKRHARHDVVMAAKKELQSKDVPRSEWPTTAELVQSEGAGWLKRRSQACGFTLQEGVLRADGYCRQTFRKPGKKEAVKLTTMDFSGVLTVTDPDLFSKALYQGIGPAKGFGCGLLLVRPLS